MQHLNWYTLAAVTRHLNAALAGGRWQDAFTQERDELVIVFRTAQGHPFFLRVSCQAHLQYVLPQTAYRRARANSVDLFPTMADAVFVRATLCPADRIIALEFENGQSLWLKMHGARSNVIRCQDGKPEELFRQQMEEDLALVWPAGPGMYVPDSKDAYDRLLWERIGETDAEALRTLFPRFDKYFVWRFEEQAQRPDGNGGLVGYGPFENLQHLIAAAENPVFHLIEEPNQPPGLLLFPLADFPASRTYTDVAEALAAFVGKWLGRQHARALHRNLERAVERALQAAEQKYNSARTGLMRLAESRSPEELGHLLMAHLHSIPPGAERATVADFYAEGQPELEIKLDPRLSPQQNAERLYTKAKDGKKKRQYLEKRLAESETNWLAVQAAAEGFAKLENAGLKELERFARENSKLLNISANTVSTPGELPFRQFEYAGYSILVGRNSKNNDELTVRYARKDDIWLHAKGVQGSHVIIRAQKNVPVPTPVIEYAAGLAAWFSKAKGSALVPVTYTPRKFVRKTKALLPGQVIVDREQVALVPPIEPVSTDQ